MKKIIKHGKSKPMIATCPDCGCEFSYEYEDIHIPTQPLSTYYYDVVNCPECGKEVAFYNYTGTYPSIPYIPYQPYWPWGQHTFYCDTDVSQMKKEEKKKNG